MTKNRTEVADIDRSLYDFTYGEEGFERLDAGITPDIVRDQRQKGRAAVDARPALKVPRNLQPLPGSDIGAPPSRAWTWTTSSPTSSPTPTKSTTGSRCPTTSRTPFERLGIPEAERSYLAGVGAQYDSELVYHNMQDTASKMGIVYSGIEEALHDPQWEPLIHEKFMTLIRPPTTSLRPCTAPYGPAARLSTCPKGTKLDFPLQSYFRLNAKGAGQFEHTLIIVEDDADLHFIEGCSAPKIQRCQPPRRRCGALCGQTRAPALLDHRELVQEHVQPQHQARARVDEDGDIEWISGSFGSHVGYLYPMSVLNGRRARSSFTGITFAGAGQNLDTGCKVVLNAPDTSATVETKGISKSGGIQTFRSSIVATPKAEGSKATVSCQSLMLDDQSRSDTIPAMDIRAKNVDIGHEATIGRIGDDKVFYLMSRGISEEEARTMIVNGFANPVSKELPLEYAVEMNNLIKLEMEGAIG